MIRLHVDRLCFGFLTFVPLILDIASFEIRVDPDQLATEEEAS